MSLDAKQLQDQVLSLIGQYGSRRLLAERIGCTKAYIDMLCQKVRYPSLDMLLKILKECGYELQVIKGEGTLTPFFKERNEGGSKYG